MLASGTAKGAQAFRTQLRGLQYRKLAYCSTGMQRCQTSRVRQEAYRQSGAIHPIPRPRNSPVVPTRPSAGPRRRLKRTNHWRRCLCCLVGGVGMRDRLVERPVYGFQWPNCHRPLDHRQIAIRAPRTRQRRSSIDRPPKLEETWTPLLSFRPPSSAQPRYQEVDARGPVSRILYRLDEAVTAIHLGRRLPAASSSLPGSRAGHPYTLPYLALLRVGFARPPCHQDAGALLPHHFTLTS
jgi:hypothetical protein